MTFDLDRRLELSPHAALKARDAGDVLVLPERAIRIGGRGSEILRLCIGGRRGHDVVAALEARYPDSPGIAEEVAAFLAEMTELGGLVSADEPSAKSVKDAST